MNMPKSSFILLILFLLSLLKAQPNSSLTSISLQDTCISGHKILPERSFYIWNYQFGDSIYTRNQVVNLLLASQPAQGIMTTSKSCTIVSVFLLCGGWLGMYLSLKDNNPVLGFSSMGIAFSGIGLFISSVGLSTKAIKVYNKSLCN